MLSLLTPVLKLWTNNFHDMDRSTLLTLVSIGLSGLFGVVGLLTDFRRKEDNKVSLAGRISLCGILITSVVSATITVLNSGEHQRELAIQTNPFDRVISVRLDFAVGGKEDPKMVKNILDQHHGTIAFIAQGHEHSCSLPSDADLLFDSDIQQPKGAWNTRGTATSFFYYHLERSSTKMTSVAQVGGSTVIISLPEFSPNVTLYLARLSVAQGVSFTVPSEGIVVAPGRVAACYTFPENTVPDAR